MNKIRKGDQVVVITGRDKGKKGTVTEILEGKLLVDGVNVYKKNVKPNPATGATGGVVDKTMPIQASNVALVDANGKPSRVGIKVADGKKVRYLKTTGAVIAA
ncbi:50S ribosomal protein L24 [Polynucleobacter sp. MWH-CaK5]|jgi:large subunit ribosomal protein L24|uniref:50S ribosomal protein L24 n=1 Tax=Polynucleobacter sp. MWH-CaK5 TaxID=2689107 RepID=UPI001BFD6B27|nr:50S ribosomal protein L24 [Polynucleobacter sp. MWH-CaK5]QWD88975.1 50S ribosomal protein L24 [Polynucleobacter sp. MWH-CaK5]